MPNINVPGVGVVAFPDTMSQDEIGVAIRQDILPSIQKSGFGAGLSGGLESLKGAALAAKYGVTGSEADRQALLESQARAAEKYQGVGLEDVQEAFRERGVLAGLGRTWEAAKGTLGQSIPFMAAPAIGAAVAPAAIPAGIAGLSAGAIGFAAPSIAQYTGTGLARQVEEQQAAMERGEQPRDLSVTKAVVGSIPATVLDRFALGKTFKGTPLGKLFGEEGEEAVKAVTNQVLSGKTNPSRLLSGAAGLGRGVSAEIGNEVGQQIIERAQAGLDLTGEEAMREYKQAAFGAALLGGPIGTMGGLSIRKAGLKGAEQTIEEARAEMKRVMGEREAYQANLAAQNLAQTQPQLPGLEMPAVTPYVRPEEAAPAAPEFELTPQGVQGELDVTTPQPAAPEVAAPAKIDTNFLKSSGLAGAIGLKAKGKNSIIGMDLNDPEQAAKIRERLLKVGETTKSGKVAEAIETLLKTDTRLQEQPEISGFPTEAEQAADQVKYDQAQAEAARQRRNQQLEQLRLSLPEVQNAAKEEAATTSAGLPSEVGAEGAPGGLEPSVGVYERAAEPGTQAGEGPSGEPLGSAERDAEGAVAATGRAGDTLDLAQLLKESEAEADRQIAEERAAKEAAAKPETDWEALLAAEGMPEDLEAIPTETETAEEAAARIKEERRAQRAMEGELTGELSWDAADLPSDYRQVAAPAAPVQGLTKEQAQGITDKLKQGWKRDVNVVVKNFADETPGRQAAMKARGLDTAKGYIDHDGTVVVLAENNKDEADVTATLFHETLGHLGLRLKFREELTNMMEKFYHTNADLKRAANKWLLDHKGEYDEKMPVAEKYAKAVEEVLAERAEAGRLPASIMDKIKAFINKWARRAGLNIDFSDAEIRAILDQAQQEITEKTGEAKTEPAKEIAPRSAAAARLEQMGRAVKQTEESSPFQEKVDAVKEVVKAPQKWRDLVETMVFSADAKINNEIRRSLNDKLEQGGQEAADAMAKLYSISTSQALHAEAVAHQFIEKGNIKYDPTTYKFQAVEDQNSWANMVQELKKIADQYGHTFPEMEAYAQAALEARRLKGVNEFNDRIEKEATALEAKGKKQQAEKHREKQKLSHMTNEQIDMGMEFFKEMPELNKIVGMWNGIRKNAMKAAVESGLYSQERAEELLEIMDYVPFYRVEQLEAKAGPKEFSRGLLDAAREYRFKGSEQEVNNIFDNMERWTSYTIRRAVNNKTAQNLVQTARDVLQEAKAVPKPQRGMEANTIAIWEDGERNYYEFSDPLFVKAFTGLEPVALPAFKALSTFSNALRKNIVLNPLFSVSQLSQDSFAAMLTSGLKQPFKLPIEVMKEFVKTLRGTSQAHEELKAYGAVGVRDYSAAISRLDAEMAAGLKAPSTWQKLLAPLEKFSMASDNAVRQAIYNMTMQETGGDKAKAIERAFEIINFRRKGASGTLAIAGQVIPFFNAYLQAQNVAYKVLTARGVSPTARSEAKKVFIGNATKIAALAFIYAAVMADDDDYKKMDPTIRDRHWIIPGTGLMLPTRTDLFSMPKIVAEHTYALLTDQGFEDGTKARRAMSDALKNAILGPTPVPQAFKPLVEVALNRNFYMGRPIIGRGIENLATAEQFTASTSEFAKAIGSTGLIAPVNVDHLLRGYFGTTGGLVLMATDAAINSVSGVPKPSKSMQDTLASTPGLSTFVSKEFGSTAKTDFYELKGMVDEVGATLNRYAKTGRLEEAREYMGEEETKNLLRVKQQVNQIQANLSKLRERENLIRALPETRMSADQKEMEIRKLRETEQRMLANVSKLRGIAGL